MCKCKSRHRSSAERLCCCLPTRQCRSLSAPPLRAEPELPWVSLSISWESKALAGEARQGVARAGAASTRALLWTSPASSSQQWKLGAVVALKASWVLIWKLSFQERHPTGLYSFATWVIKKFIGESANFNNGQYSHYIHILDQWIFFQAYIFTWTLCMTLSLT